MATGYGTLKRKVRDFLIGSDLGRKILVGRRLGTPDAFLENGTLKETREWQSALEQVRRLGLPPHPEPTKNWDSLAALACILGRTAKDARILDAGSERYSVILPWLCLYGYADLFGINLVFDSAVRLGPITYEHGDVTGTRFETGSFDAVTCLSVIEHGVDAEMYFREMSRILKRGGVLITSVDYYETPVETAGKEAYGMPIHIYCREEVAGLIDAAARSGLKLTGPLDLRTERKVIRWETVDLEYTYLLFTMEKIF